jgi:uncharacterized membrane protein YphA (DoxX/SURF4 family)
MNWFGAVMGIIQPKSAATPIRTDQPISAEQQAANQKLFFIAMVVLLVITGVGVWYLLRM